jgi:hypothetical protein
MTKHSGTVAVSEGPQQVYWRQLPGGGHVTIEITSGRNLLGKRGYVGRVIVERRTADRRAGHEPPVIAEARGPSAAEAFHELFPIAHSNTIIATSCLRRQHSRQTVGAT